MGTDVDFQRVVVSRKCHEYLEFIDHAKPLLRKRLRERAKTLAENCHAVPYDGLAKGPIERRLSAVRPASGGQILAARASYCLASSRKSPRK
jgi:hypothetical protein